MDIELSILEGKQHASCPPHILAFAIYIYKFLVKIMPFSFHLFHLYMPDENSLIMNYTINLQYT